MWKKYVCLIFCILLLLGGCAAEQGMPEEQKTPTEPVAIGNVTFGWLPEDMREAERIEIEGFCYILFRGEHTDCASEGDYAAFFYKELEPTGSGKITGTRLKNEDLEQEALDNGAEQLKVILDSADSSVSLSSARGDENGENRYTIYVRTFADGYAELKQIWDQLNVK